MPDAVGSLHRGERLRLIALSAFLVSACGPTGTGADTQNLDGSGGGGGTAAAQVIYVNFDGALISDCADAFSDAPSDRSWAISELFGRTEMAFAPYDNAAGKTQIITTLKSAYAAYDVYVTTDRPLERGTRAVTIV